MESFEQEISELKERNARVEANKAWEISATRIVAIALITYCVAAITLFLIGASNILLSALVPVIGFLLSTLSLPPLKRFWIKQFHERK